ncbi:general stress protein CsbD [Horticoccus luteus]|uniref:General stress protein CsbD n=1 Tax=Horticoccus luteus TaxID=2862869 RepID=A0A8F9TUX4_9BACT|nr:general stress protein CsbD [Horticoccus luteus]QYM78032.1 general stress protein CsbD [Horticoccus luteus]
MNADKTGPDWKTTREKLREKFKNLREDDLQLANGQGEGLVDRIQQRTGANRAEIEKYLREECGCR